MAKNYFPSVNYPVVPDIDDILTIQDLKTLRQSLYTLKTAAGEALLPNQALRIQQSLSNQNGTDEIGQIASYIVSQIPPDAKRFARYLKFQERTKECTRDLKARGIELTDAEDVATQTGTKIKIKALELQRLQRKAKLFMVKYITTVSLLSMLTTISLVALAGLTVASIMIPPAFPATLVFGSAALFAVSVFGLGMAIAGMNSHYRQHYTLPIQHMKEKLKNMRHDLSNFMLHIVRPLKHKIYQLEWVGAIFENVTNTLAASINPPQKQSTFWTSPHTLPALDNQKGAAKSSMPENLDNSDLDDPGYSTWDAFKGMICRPFRTKYERV